MMQDSQTPRQEPVPPELKKRIIAAISEHVRVHGRRDYDKVREHPAFGAVIGEQAGANGHRRFYRWLKVATKPTPPDKTRPHETRETTDEVLADAADRAREMLGRHLPVAPPPTFFMKMGADADVMINMIEAANEIWGDYQLCRTQAVEDRGPDGGVHVKAPKLLMQAANARSMVLERMVRLFHDVYHIEAMHRWYREIGDIILVELEGLPEVQARVLDRLEQLNNAQAMTPFARPRG